MRKFLTAGMLLSLALTGCVPGTAPVPTLAPTVAAPTEAGPAPTTAPPPTGYPVVTEPSLPTAGPAPTDAYPVATSAPATAPTATPLAAPTAPAGAAGFALRFFGTGAGDVDRVKFKLDNPAIPADIGAGDFTLEFWLKANPGENPSVSAGCGNVDGWITGNIVFDRDIWGAGEHGDFGLSLANGRVVFGLAQGEQGTTLCATTDVTDGAWHHVAVTRQAETGQVRVYVDGRLEAEAVGPRGDISYRDGRGTAYANDPFLVIGAEKHDYDPAQYPPFQGWVDEARLSAVIRYAGDFDRPRTPFTPDADTLALWHFDEGAGEVVGDAAAGGASAGQLKVGGPNNGPQWVPSDAPLGAP